MNYKILDFHWRSALHTVGFVAYATENPVNPGEWNSVVGYKPILKIIDGLTGTLLGEDVPNTEIEVQYIAANGAKLEYQLAAILFPKLDITKHKYFNQ